MKKLLILCTVIALFSFSIHKYYIALTEIEFKEDRNTVQMIMNVFIDDFENTINQQYNIDAKLNHPKQELKNLDLYIKKYLHQHFKISINDVSQNYTFIGKEYQGNIVFFYLEIENISQVKNIAIENTMLLTYYPEQQNLIKAKINENRKSLFLTQENPKGLLNF